MKKYKFINENRNFRINEAYKTLRTNLMFCGKDIKVVAITSCSPGDGKSYVTKNLAISLAEVGKNVLLIDADLRKSTMIKNVEADGEILGLSHLLSGQTQFENVIFQNKKIPTLFTIFAGSFPPNPAELLSCDEFTRLIENARNEFDYILIDTPPLGSVIDSAIIADRSDGMIMVIRSDKTNYRFACGVKEQMEKTNCRILGAVLNAVDVSDKSKYYHKYYSNYYYNDYSNYYKDKSV